MLAALLDQYRLYIGATLLALLALWKFWPSIQPRLTALWSRRVSEISQYATELVIDVDTADFQALKRLQDRFARQQCPEGQAAVDTCLAHFFHGAAPDSEG